MMLDGNTPDASSRDLMSFKRIWSLRRTPEGTAYQEALRAATAVRGTKQWKKHYVRYLETIPDYFERIGSDARIELVDWQKVLARQETERRERFARRLGKGVAFPWAVGVLAGAVSWWLYELSPAGVEHITHRFGRRKFSRPDHEAGLELATSDDEWTIGD